MALPLYNIRFILLITCSFITIFSSIAIYFCLPILISHVIRTQISLSMNSGSFNDWRLNSVIDRIYLYNITNLDELLAPKQSFINDSNDSSSAARLSRPIPHLDQVGPFTFRQIREKINILFNPTNETVVYDQKKSWFFLPELSVVKTIEDLSSTWINHVSVPLAGTTLSPEYAEFIDPIVTEWDLKLFMNHSANILLFEGYPDILMENAKNSGQIDVDKFGWMHNQNNSLTRNIRVFTGPSNATLDKLGSIDLLNNQNRFKIWHNNNTEPNDTSNVECNQFRFSSAGEFFPPPPDSFLSHIGSSNNNRADNSKQSSDLKNEKNDKATIKDLNASLPMVKTKSPEFSIVVDKQPAESIETNSIWTAREKTVKTISLFMPDLCRTFRLTYNHTLTYKDLKVDRYIANEFTYDYTTPIGEQQGKKIKSSNDEDTISITSNKIGGGNNSNRCYCNYNENTKLTSCPPNGMMDLFTCRKGSPLTISFPHFLHSNKDESLEPYLKLFQDPIAPEESEHQFFIDLESTLNIPIRAQIVIQFNVHYRNEPSLNFTKDYSFLFESPNIDDKRSSALTDLYLPQMWFKSTAEIDEKNLNNLRFIQQHLELVTPIATIIICGFASILLTMSAKLAYDLTYGPRSRKSTSLDEESCSSLNRNESSYLDDKHTYYAMQLLGNEKAQCLSNNINNNGCGNNNHDDSLNKPTTSKINDTGGERQPLNS